MKKILIGSLICTNLLFANIPESINFHSIAFDDSGNALTDSTIAIKIELLDSSSSALYVETNASVTTDSKGIFGLKIGTQTTVTGVFSELDFSEVVKVKVSADLAGGTSYTEMGTQDFSTVPFAFVAKSLEGNNTTADQANMTAIGRYNTANNTDALFVVGNGVSGATNDAFVVYNDGNVSVEENLTVGGKLYVNGTEITATTILNSSGTSATSFASLAWGSDTNASGDYSTAWGNDTNASGESSTAFGNGTTASGSYSTALGKASTASGDYSIASGLYTEASGSYSTVFGVATTASGDNSIASGQYSTASGKASTASGWNTKASATSSTAWGNNTEALGESSTAFGDKTEASGKYSTAWGYETNASEWYSTATGLYTTADQDYMTAIGKYNTVGNTDALFVIGNGTGTGNKKDAFSVYDTGNATLAGVLTQNSDKRLKTNIKKIDNSIEKVKGISGVTYNWIDKNKEQSTQVGVIAQDVQKAMPELVREGNNGYLSVSYTSMVGLLVEAIKEQQKEIESLKEENKKINKIIKALSNAGISIEE